MYRHCGAIALFSMIFAACGASHRKDPREHLPEALRDFHNQLVWGRYAEAAGYLPSEQRAHFIGTYDELDEDLRFTEYELGSVDVNAADSQATVMVTLSWFREPYYVVEQTRVRQIWELNEDDDYWWLVRREDPDRPPPGSEAAADGPMAGSDLGE